MPSLRRRRVLEFVASGGFAALAGCSSGAPDCAPRYELRLATTSDADFVEVADRPPGDLHPLGRDLVRTARESGTATYHSAPPRGISDELFPISRHHDPPHRFVRLDGSHYRLAVDVAEHGTTTERVLVGKANGDVDADARSGDSVEFDALPRHDRRSLLAFLGRHATTRSDAEFGWLWSLGYLRDEHVESSLLVPRPAHDFVRYREWFLSVERTDTGRGTRITYDVSLEHVADSETGLVAAVKEMHGLDLDASDLSTDQRELLDEAAGGTHWVCLDDASDREDGEVRWVDRDDSAGADDWRALENLLETIGDARYVRYGGQWYSVDGTRWGGSGSGT